MYFLEPDPVVLSANSWLCLLRDHSCWAWQTILGAGDWIQAMCRGKCFSHCIISQAYLNTFVMIFSTYNDFIGMYRTINRWKLYSMLILNITNIVNYWIPLVAYCIPLIHVIYFFFFLPIFTMLEKKPSSDSSNFFLQLMF